MSKLAKLIDATMTGDVGAYRAISPKYIDVVTSVSDELPYGTSPRSYTYKLGVSLYKIVAVKENTRVQEILHDVKMAMIEEIFGEFRPIISEMRAGLYEEDTARLRALISELENQMFNDGI